MDEYQYPLFFEAKDLTDRDKEKLWRHFQKKRDSGGGDCGMIKKIGDNIYEICFKEKEVQERVLLRKLHTISLPSGELHLTVSRTSSSQTTNQPQSQTSIKSKAKSLEKIFKLDVYLLYYLRDTPKAYKVLKKQLSAIGCTVELDIDEEEAVVSGDIEKGPGRGFSSAEKWELQVDRVFIGLTDTYTCHHVLEPKQIRIIQQDSSFKTEDFKVYSEIGYSVVVGEVGAVKDRIAILEKSVPIRKTLPVVEKKFKLVEEEFSREMRAHYPEVRMLIENTMIILEGPDKEVQSGASKLEDLMKTVQEKTVKLPTDLITFIQSSKCISKYQTRFQQSLRNPVFLEVGSDLVLTSLSSGALNEAEAAVQRDLTVDTVQLQGAAAVPPDLDQVKEKLIRAKKDANSRELRVDVSFIPGLRGSTVTKVRLVGYSEDVNKLKDVLQDYQMNSVLTTEVLNISQELFDCFDKVLDLIGMKQTKVTVKASLFPNPCVVISGPRRLVQEVQADLKTKLASLTSDTLVIDGPGAQWYFQGDGKTSKELVETSCQVIIREQQGLCSPNAKQSLYSQDISSFSLPNITLRSFRNRTRSSTVSSMPLNKINLKIKLGSLEDEQVNVLVAPMLNKKLTSTNIGSSLSSKAGIAITSKFESEAAKCTLIPGDVLQVGAPPSLGCSKLFFIECAPWDGVRGQSVQDLSKGLKRCLDLCVQQGWHSVAFPVIGPGVVLKFPLREAIEVLTENIKQFGVSASFGSLSTIHVVIKPGYPDSEECYHDVYKPLSLSMNQGGQVIFRSLTSDLDEITVTVGGGVKLQVVFGDITNETTDGIVNTTDFVHFYKEGVCKDILTVAGPEVEDDLKKAKVNRGKIFVSQPGSFPCEAILHMCGENNAGLIEQLVDEIVQHCEAFGLKSVAIPAIGAGAGGMDPGVVAAAIIRGVKTATSSTPLYHLTNIRLVLIKINVFLAFKQEVLQVFHTALISRVPAPQIPNVQQQSPLSVNADSNIIHNIQQSVFLFLGIHKNNVEDAKTKLKDLYQAQCSTQTFTKQQLESLTQDDMKELKQMVKDQGLYMQEDHYGQGSLTVSGLKDGVTQMMGMITECLQDSHKREVRVRDEDDLYTRVAWCILGLSGNWERLPKEANYNLENNQVVGGIVDIQGMLWTVDPLRTAASEQRTNQTTKLKRLENLPDFTFPLDWDDMAVGDTMKVVVLQSSSPEYQRVKEAFKRTVTKTVMKIERLQNIHLRRAYEARKKQISDKIAQQGGAGEMLLYHGTTQENCKSIMNTGFNRSFAGQNATVYGLGTYFAVNASYSANPTYSKPADDGSQLMFVVRVLTGLYTLGCKDMRVPPLRNDQQPHDRYDSVVDKINNPSMYVVFHDNQAYPDYLITFK